MIALSGAVLLAGGATGLVLMIVLQRTIVGEGGIDVPREEDPARFRRNVALNGALAAAGAVLLWIGLG